MPSLPPENAAANRGEEAMKLPWISRRRHEAICRATEEGARSAVAQVRAEHQVDIRRMQGERLLLLGKITSYQDVIRQFRSGKHARN